MNGRCRRLLLALPIVVLCGITACSSDRTTPASPTPTTPVTTTTPPTTTPPSSRVLTFTPDTPTPIGEAVAITVASRGQEDGKIALAVTAFNMVNQSNLGGSPGIAGVYGRVRWDSALLVNDAAGIGDLMRQDGVEPSCCTPGEADIVAADGTFPFSIQRRPGTPLVSGSGEIVLFRLVPRAGVTSGTSRLDFIPISPLFPELIRLRPFPTYAVPQNVYGGTITIR